MTPPDFSVLLLAWDDADPQVAVLGGAALPPTLPLVYQLATQHPVVALYPHLPATENPAANPSAQPVPPTANHLQTTTAAEAAAAPTVPEAASDALATTVAGPGVQLLPTPTAETDARHAPVQVSRIVGLAELLPAELPLAAAVTETALQASVSITAALAAPGRSQWPTGINAPVFTKQWQAPAAPYLGAGSGAFFPPPPPAPPRLAAPKAAQSGVPTSAPVAPPRRPTAAEATPITPLQPRQLPLAGDLNFDPDPELPAVTIQQPALFDEPTEEIGAAEANDISAPEDDLVPDAPAPVESQAAPEPAALPAAAAPQMPQLEGLNFRMIQYARQAAQLVQHRPDFGVIYAPNWPAWLAALEIRNSSRQPLVLYLTSLAADFAGPAERGWLPELERMTLRRATLVLVPDATVQRRLVALYGGLAGEIRVLAADDEAAVQRMLGEVALR
ncbi:glycosyltransferase family 4 protein [Hymenobacter negativus]|uniref:Glycosyltransferase subfamily 4-like N-terminal domain-containing protein n=1 Tax=Hymenobacter negativus TaxID=2795026 RepID=A0ABS3QHM9_9BACT|nr:glycosyltransferase family 4 protein [Hymenobacter negativus]MBO2010737.1 hypothetical protein [Hymenobacter negativus]